MSQSYMQTSCLLKVPKEKKEQAIAITQRVIEEFENGRDPDMDCFVGEASWSDEDGGGIWFRHDESVNIQQVADMAADLMLELDLLEPFIIPYCMWSAKPVIGGFGGGSILLYWANDPDTPGMQGVDTIHTEDFDGTFTAQQFLKDNLL